MAILSILSLSIYAIRRKKGRKRKKQKKGTNKQTKFENNLRCDFRFCLMVMIDAVRQMI